VSVNTMVSEDGSAGAIIWPGAAARQAGQAKIQAGYPVEIDPDTSSATRPVGQDSPAQALLGLSGGCAAVPWPMLQNEAGSLVMPETWRYVPPPPDQLPQPPRPPEPLRADSAGTDCRNPDTEASATAEDDAEAGDEDSEQMLLDADGKRALLEDLVDFLIARAERCEKELEAEQRANRALSMSLEAEQRKSAVLQQQVVWLAQQAGWQIDGVSTEAGEQQASHDGA